MEGTPTPRDPTDERLTVAWRDLDTLNGLLSDLPWIDSHIVEAEANGEPVYEWEEMRRGVEETIDDLYASINQEFTTEYNPNTIQ